MLGKEWKPWQKDKPERQYRVSRYTVEMQGPHMSDGLTKTSDDLDRDYQKTIQPSETSQDQLRYKILTSSSVH